MTTMVEMCKEMDKELYFNDELLISNTGKLYDKATNTEIKLSTEKNRVPKTTRIFKKLENGEYLRMHVNGHRYGIHELVAYYWLNNPNNYKDVIHVNHNNDDNNVTNLQWVSKSGYKSHIAKKGNFTKQSQKDNGTSNNYINEDYKNEFTNLGIINDNDFSNYEISIDGRVIKNIAKNSFVTYCPNNDNYVNITLKDSNNIWKCLALHKIINHVLMEGNYHELVDHLGGGGGLNNDLLNLEAVTITENNRRAHGKPYYKINPNTMELIETIRCLPDIYENNPNMIREIMECVDSKTTKDGFQWRRVEDETKTFNIIDNIIIDISEISIENNNLNKVYEINDNLKRDTHISIEFYYGSTDSLQTFKCHEFDLEFKTSWDNMKSRRKCNACSTDNKAKIAMKHLLPIYKYNYDVVKRPGNYIIDEYKNIDDLMERDEDFKCFKNIESTKKSILDNCLGKTVKCMKYYNCSFYPPVNKTLNTDLQNLSYINKKRFRHLGLI
jgi:hypothetical protein